MLPFGLKIVWFLLSFLGTLSCWLVLTAFAKVIKTCWAPVMYCVAVTLLEGTFWLGAIWKMDPFLMPREFCIAQVAVMGFACFLLTGACAASTLATGVYVLRPKLWGNTTGSLLPWRPQYLVPLVLFPCLASIVQITVLLKVDIDWRGDDFACDVNQPEWARFMSYAGLPFLLTIPIFFLSTRSAIRVIRTHRHLERSRCRELASSFPPASPQHSTTKDISGLHSPPIPNLSSQATGCTSPIFGLTIAPSLVQTIRLPDPPGLDEQPHSASSARDPDTVSIVSSSIPTFAPPSNTPYAADYAGDDGYRPKSTYDYDAREMDKSVVQDDSPTSVQSFRLQNVRRSPFERLTSSPGRRLPPNLPDTIWRLILFQMVFCAVQLLSSISTLIDAIARHKTPTPFGTQHVALLLAAWGPLLVFGPLAVVWQQVKCWGSNIIKSRW